MRGILFSSSHKKRYPDRVKEPKHGGLMPLEMEFRESVTEDCEECGWGRSLLKEECFGCEYTKRLLRRRKEQY